MKFNSEKGKKWLISGVFWAISFYISLEVFSRTGEYRLIDIIYTVLFHVPMVFAVTAHSHILLPKYLAKARFMIYSIWLLALYVGTIGMYFFSFNLLSNWLFPGYYLVGIFSWVEIGGLATIYLILSASLEFGRSWFSNLQTKNKIMELESQKTASELKTLRAQIHPHFLFNSLNTIYSEALKKSEKAPGLILKLSDMLRYVVDKMEADKVSLDKEVEYLKDFVDLHKERLNEPEKVSFHADGEFEDVDIAPLLLITFVENCFKHSDLTEERSFISIELKLAGKELKMRCANTIFKDKAGSKAKPGTGIKNALRRLELVYPDRHKLKISETNDRYELILTLNLN